MRNRTLALCRALGWQGGTIHQVAEATGCSVDGLLYGEPSSKYLGSDHCKGWFAGRTCSLEFNLERNFPPRHGNLDFWLGVADGLSLDLERGVA